MSFEPKKGWLSGKEIPLNEAGDPAFTEVYDDIEMDGPYGCNPTTVMTVFSNEEIVYLVNKALYVLAYQREHHKKRAAAEREALAPVKRKVKELFGVSYLNATDDQLHRAIEAVTKEQLENLELEQEHRKEG